MSQSKEPRYVQRDPVTREITGHFANLQPGYAEEELPDDHPDLKACRDKRAAARLAVAPHKALEVRVAVLEEQVRGLLAKAV